ncbi:MAG: hypothetical protein H0W84_00250 [Bacteroidetes bacterium]|nr:hypothetical protein [Bacteroidota bacterium]
MKTLTFISLFLLSVAGTNILAQETAPAVSSSPEKYGKTLNLGAGIGYYGYVGHTLPVGTLNFEFDVARNFTLAPFVGFYSYRNYYYWGNPNKPYEDNYREYSYRVTAVPVGLKGTYYFDELFRANERWDFYAAGSVGFVFRSVTWENDYYGDRRIYHSASPLYLDAHIGAELHLNSKAGLFLDLSTGVSTFGLAIHF